MRSKLLVAIVFPLVAATGSAQCRNLVFPGSIPPSPWTAAGSPYCVVGSVTIPAALTIEAGTVVEVHGSYTITMAGSLTVAGTASAPVRFVRGPAAASWRGLVLQNAGTIVDHLHLADASASGITIETVGVTLGHVRVSHCASDTLGGGLRIKPPTGASGTIAIHDTWITDNRSASHGGGVHASLPAGVTLEFTDTTIARNRSNPTAANGGYYGGGAFVTGAGSVRFTRATVRQNTSIALCNTVYYCGVTGGGGGLYADVDGLTLRQCSFEQNTARAIGPGGGGSSYAHGGGLHATGSVATLTIVNSTFACNSANATSPGNGSRGGGIYSASPAATLSHVTLYNNTCGGGASGQNVYVAGGALTGDHCIAFSRTGAAGHGIAGTATFTYSDIEGGYAGTGNFAATPGFADANGCDRAALLLGPGASVIDMGDPMASADDASRPPAYGTARADVGHLGGPANGAWLRPASPFALALVPSHLDRAWGIAPLYTALDGATPGAPTAVVLTGFDNTPIAPMWVGLFGLVCPTRTSTFELPLPVAPPLLVALQFTGVTLTNGTLVLSPPQTLTIR